MFNRREFLAASLAASAATLGSGLGPWARVAAQQQLTEDGLLGMSPVGNLTILNVTDIHAQLTPVWFREPSINLGVGEAAGVPPHVTGADFLELYGIEARTPEAYALTSEDFVSLARQYGRMGGLDRIAHIVKRTRAERGESNVILLDGGDTWQGSYTALQTRGGDMVEAMNLLRPDAMTSHWEFTYGGERVRELVDELPFPFLGQNIFDVEWDEPAFEAMTMLERGGSKVAVIGQAFPYLPIANPRYMFEDLSFGIREENLAEKVEEARADGADVVVLLSHNGFDVDRKLASRVPGIDVILTGHTHDALPEPLMVGETMLIAAGSNGKFVGRLDLDVRDGRIADHAFRLIPVFSDVIGRDEEMSATIERLRAPYADELARVLGRTDDLLYRRGNFNGTWDDLILDALLKERDAEIALSPGFRWGTTVLPGQEITVEDLFDATAMTYPEAYRTTMTGEFIKTVLEDVADNLFNPDPYYQQGGDMVRVGGMTYAIDPLAPAGARVSDMRDASGEPLDPAREYTVAGWASVNEGTEGPPIWDVVSSYIESQGTVTLGERAGVNVRMAG